MVFVTQEVAELLEDEEAATSDETLAFFIKRSRRNRIPIRRTFLRGPAGEPAPLAEFVSARRGLALDLFLLHAGLASAPPWDLATNAAVWARMLDLPPTQSSETSVTRQWKWLAEQALV